MFSGEYWLNYFQTLSQANGLRVLAVKTKGLVCFGLEQDILSIDSNWDGEASQEFRKRMKLLDEEIRKELDNLLVISEKIKWRANKVHEAEEAAKALANSRTSG